MTINQPENIEQTIMWIRNLPIGYDEAENQTRELDCNQPTT
jgi:hypothetical protein